MDSSDHFSHGALLFVVSKNLPNEIFDIIQEIFILAEYQKYQLIYFVLAAYEKLYIERK